MSSLDLEKIRAHVKATTAPPLNEPGAWFEHLVRMQVEQFGWAKADNPSPSIDEFLKVGWKPKLRKRKR